MCQENNTILQIPTENRGDWNETNNRISHCFGSKINTAALVKNVGMAIVGSGH